MIKNCYEAARDLSRSDKCDCPILPETFTDNQISKAFCPSDFGLINSMVSNDHKHCIIRAAISGPGRCRACWSSDAVKEKEVAKSEQGNINRKTDKRPRG